ncbi:hypothetical protein EMIT0P44_30040 [Pseudomonas sp. IT-P44]|uniref:hypothetical protein n=1 Tax=Pseudomonas sp. IT-P44 TaxID=3026451 RepID=UPI0039DFDFA0
MKFHYFFNLNWGEKAQGFFRPPNLLDLRGVVTGEQASGQKNWLPPPCRSQLAGDGGMSVDTNID